jgi:nucleoside-diphosphate kinase
LFDSKKSFKLVAAKFVQISQEQARQLYSVHQGKSFFEELVAFISSAPVLMLVCESEDIISMSRKMMGATFGFDAEPSTIRGDFDCTNRYNLVHCPDSVESAEREINLFFQPDEIIDYDLTDADWLYGEND